MSPAVDQETTRLMGDFLVAGVNASSIPQCSDIVDLAPYGLLGGNAPLFIFLLSSLLIYFMIYLLLQE